MMNERELILRDIYQNKTIAGINVLSFIDVVTDRLKKVNVTSLSAHSKCHSWRSNSGLSEYILFLTYHSTNHVVM